MATALWTAAGILLVAAALLDVFQTLLRPGSTGRLTHLIFRAAWALVRGPRRASVSGPLTIVLVIAVWITLVTVGWALIYFPHLPDGFAFNGVDPGRYPPFVEAMTISLVTLTTLGYGDVVPIYEVLRAVSPLEALTGFILLSAAVSWFMQLYPALARRRAFALRLASLARAGTIDGFPSLSESRALGILDATTHDLADVTADLAQNAEIFYFREHDPTMSMPRAAGYVLQLRDAAGSSEYAAVQMQGRALAAVLDELASVLLRQYPHVRGESADDVLGHVATNHGHRFEAPDSGA